MEINGGQGAFSQINSGKTGKSKKVLFTSKLKRIEPDASKSNKDQFSKLWYFNHKILEEMEILKKENIKLTKRIEGILIW